MNIKSIFEDVSRLLPEGVEARAVSIYSLPYPNYMEVFVEGTDGSRYRALANKVQILSEFVKLDVIPPVGGLKNGLK